MRAIKPFMSLDVMKMVYHAYVHSILNYGIIFWGNASLSVNIFKIQKRIIRVISGVGKFSSCRDLFKKLQILPLPSQYIFSLLLFTIKNNSYFTFNTDIHEIQFNLIYLCAKLNSHRQITKLDINIRYNYTLIPGITTIYTCPLQIY
jgi:hypothetical protein